MGSLHLAPLLFDYRQLSNRVVSRRPVNWATDAVRKAIKQTETKVAGRGAFNLAVDGAHREIFSRSY